MSTLRRIQALLDKLHNEGFPFVEQTTIKCMLNIKHIPVYIKHMIFCRLPT